MKKFLLTACLAGLTALASYSSPANVNFTYATGELNMFGARVPETLDIAIRVDDPGLAGMKVTGVYGYIYTDKVTDASVWMANQLKLKGAKNDPDIISIPTAPRKSTFLGYNVVALGEDLDEPYTIEEGKPFYAGYTMTIKSVATEEEQYPILGTNGMNPNGFFLHSTQTMPAWTSMSQQMDCVVAIELHLEADLKANVMELISGKNPMTIEGENFDVQVAVANLGSEPVAHITYTYFFDDDQTVKNGEFNFTNPLPTDLANYYVLNLPFEALKTTGTHWLNLTIDKVNGQPNEANQPSADIQVSVLPYKPVKRPLVEEYTGLWCGWCPRGFYAMQLIDEMYGNGQVSICYHNNSGGSDPMTITTKYPVNVDGFPKGSIDRTVITDPYFGTSGEFFGINEDFLAAQAETTFADIQVSATLEDNRVAVSSTSTFLIDDDNANYEVGYVLVCNGLSSPTWAQTNYFPMYASSYRGTPLEFLATEWSSKQYGLVFNDVAVDVQGMTGVSGSIPSSVKMGVNYTHNYSFNIFNNRLINDPENLVVTAFIIDKKTGAIVNANKFKLAEYLSTAGINAEEVTSTEYYDLTGRKIANPDHGIYIKVETLVNGKTRSTKVAI